MTREEEKGWRTGGLEEKWTTRKEEKGWRTRGLEDLRRCG